MTVEELKKFLIEQQHVCILCIHYTTANYGVAKGLVIYKSIIMYTFDCSHATITVFILF